MRFSAIALRFGCAKVTASVLPMLKLPQLIVAFWLVCETVMLPGPDAIVAVPLATTPFCGNAWATVNMDPKPAKAMILACSLSGPTAHNRLRKRSAMPATDPFVAVDVAVAPPCAPLPRLFAISETTTRALRDLDQTVR